MTVLRSDLMAGDPCAYLRELLADDRRAGVELDGPTFAQRVHVAVKATRAGRSWRWAIVDTYPAWRDAYNGVNAGSMASLSLDLLDDEGGDRHDAPLEPAGV